MFGPCIMARRFEGLKELLKCGLSELIQPLAVRYYDPYKAYDSLSPCPSLTQFKENFPKKRSNESVFDVLRGSSRFFFSSEERESTVKELRLLIGEEGGKKILDEAEQILGHEFHLLGAELDFGKEIDWRIDGRSGRKWGLERSHGELPLLYPDDSDIKVVWELSRFQHLVPLGKAYWLTLDEKYAEEFVAQVVRWIEENPVGHGPNWASAMDVAIRAVNWICAFHFFRRSPTPTNDFWDRFTYLLYLHGYEISSHLETRRNRFGFFVNNNHFMANLCGLVFLGVLFRDLEVGKQWLELSIPAFEKEILRQVNSDGCDFESSISYHRLVLEFVSYTVIFLSVNGIGMPDRVIRCVRDMFQFVGSYTNHAGKAPQIGDNDDGRFIIFGKYSGWDRPDHSYLVDLGKTLFNGEPPKEENTFWLTRMCAGFPEFPLNVSDVSKAFKKSGYYILRNSRCHMMISAGPCGTGKRGNHKHNDTFSFTLSRKGTDVAVDPGSYVYSADIAMRNLFRSTQYHNTLQVGEYQINPFDPQILFRMEEHAKPRVLEWQSTDLYDLFSGRHRGFCQGQTHVIHQRNILFNKTADYWLILDRVTGRSQQGVVEPVYLRFHLSLEAIIEEDSPLIEVPTTIHGDLDRLKAQERLQCLNHLATAVRLPDKQSVYFIPFLPAESKVEKRIEEGFVSPSYGKKVPGKVLVYKAEPHTGGFSCCILILAKDH